MAGHSKWAKIKRQKGAADIKKGQIFTRYVKEIVNAIRLGGGNDPDYNFRLRNAVERAKDASVPGDVIKRALKQDKSDRKFEEILYEGYGPSGVALLVQVSTDNRNRTATELRSIFSRGGGNLGESGCVKWSFRRLGVIYLTISTDEDEDLLEEKLLEMAEELALEDLDGESGGESFMLFVRDESLYQSLQILQAKGFVCSGELTYLAESGTSIELDAETAEKLDSLVNKLEDLDDVQEVFHTGIYTWQRCDKELLDEIFRFR